MNRKHAMGMMAIGLVGMLWGLSRIGSNSAQGSGSSGDKWRVSEDRSPMDDSKTVTLALDSEDIVQGSLETTKPSLIIRCQEKKSDVYVVTGMAASVEEGIDGGPSDFHKVRIRLDDGAARYESWGESTDHKALFASDIVYDQSGHIAAVSGGIAAFAKELTRDKTLIFQFTPFNGNPQVARFDLRGLDTHLNKVAEACHWHVDELGRRY